MEPGGRDDSAQDAESEISSDHQQLLIHDITQSYPEERRLGALPVEGYDQTLERRQARWNRLSKHYNDLYLDFFLNSQSADDSFPPLVDSQFGSVTWTSSEKTRFFSALTRKGRHNLPELATAVGTKSVVEIKDYLTRLKEADTEHQMFASHAKNVSFAEMQIAVEINPALEGELEQAADALAAFQDKYDLAKARGSGGLWLIDAGTAQAIDEQNKAREGREENNAVERAETDDRRAAALQMFHFETLLELSKSIFMNSAANGELSQWTDHAEEGEEPSLTVEVAEILYNLTKSLVQRILQTSLFLALSRLRSMTTRDYTPSKVLKDIDVVAALNILNMPVDSWDYWTHFPRRSGLCVVLGDHRKGQNEPLTPEQVERVLSVRSSRGRHRSLSGIVSRSSQEPEVTSDHETEGGPQQGHISMSIESEEDQGFSADSGGENSQSSSLDDDGDDDGSDSDSEEEGGAEGQVTGDQNQEISSEPERQDAHRSRKRRRIMTDASQDDFLENLDHAAQLGEEYMLQQILGPGGNTEEPVPELTRRPRTKRKTREDLQDWSEMEYRSSWEKMAPFLEHFSEDD